MNRLLTAALVTVSVSLFAGNPIHPEETSPIFKKTKRSSLYGERKMQMNAEGQANGVVKWNLSQLAFKNISFQAEYGFHKNFSGALGFSFLIPRSLPGFFAEEDPTGEGLRNTSFKGWAVTPEFRIYPGKKEEHQAPHGFYLGPYLRYAKYTFTSGWKGEYNREFNYNLDVYYKGITVGGMMGCQWILGKHFSLDLWIAGLGMGAAKFGLEGVVSGVIANADEQNYVREQFEELFSGIRIVSPDVEISTTTNTIRVETKAPMWSIRGAGFCIGFAF